MSETHVVSFASHLAAVWGAMGCSTGNVAKSKVAVYGKLHSGPRLALIGGFWPRTFIVPQLTHMTERARRLLSPDFPSQKTQVI
jgi:hypothetical protein